MRGQSQVVVRGRRAPAALFVALLLTVGGLTGCSSADEPERAVRTAASASVGPETVDTGTSRVARLEVPAWFPEGVPVPRGAQVIGVRDDVCTVSVVVSGSDARVEAAAVGEAARSNGLDVQVVSSVTSTPPLPETDVWSEEPVAPPPDTHAVVLRLERAASAPKGEAAVLVTLTSNGDGLVVGAYQLVGGTCRG